MGRNGVFVQRRVKVSGRDVALVSGRDVTLVSGRDVFCPAMFMSCN